MSAEDPRELARRLAEEAKKRLREVPPPAAAAPAPRPPAVDRPAAERSAPPPKRKMTAQEALAAAREAEKQAARQPKPPAPAPAPAPTPAVAASAPQSAPRSATANRAEPASFSIGDYGAIVLETFNNAGIGKAKPVPNREVFTALWRAHRTRATHENQVALGRPPRACCSTPRGACPRGRWSAARSPSAMPSGPSSSILSRRAVLAAAQPAEIYLAGCWRSRSRTVLHPTGADDLDAVHAALTDLHSGGSTAMQAGIALAYQLAERSFVPGHVNRVHRLQRRRRQRRQHRPHRPLSGHPRLRRARDSR